jgi:AcrR family transcriptional regulator
MRQWGMASVNQAPRLYRGISPSERRAQRRERLLEAGLQLFGTEGYADSSIRAVCEQASLNTRYFYESFSGREDLLYNVYAETVRDLATEVIEVTARAESIEDQARAGLRAAWTILTDDPRKAKVIFLEVVGVSERLERLRRDNMHAFADLIVQNSRLITRGAVPLRLDPVLTARSLMGAVVDTQVDWINGDVDASVEQIVEHFTEMFTAVAYASVVDVATICKPAANRAAGLGRDAQSPN